MVKKFIINPSKIKNKADISKTIKVTGSQATTRTGKLIRNNNLAVPLNPQASLNNPRSGNFATKKRFSKLG